MEQSQVVHPVPHVARVAVKPEQGDVGIVRVAGRFPRWGGQEPSVECIAVVGLKVDVMEGNAQVVRRPLHLARGEEDELSLQDFQQAHVEACGKSENGGDNQQSDDPGHGD